MYFPKTHHFDVGLEKGISSERLVGKKSLTLALYRRLKQTPGSVAGLTFSKSFAWFSGVVGPGTSVRSLVRSRIALSVALKSSTCEQVYVAGGIFCRGII